MRVVTLRRNHRGFAIATWVAKLSLIGTILGMVRRQIIARSARGTLQYLAKNRVVDVYIQKNLPFISAQTEGMSMLAFKLKVDLNTNLRQRMHHN
jgi:hypothetical protein